MALWICQSRLLSVVGMSPELGELQRGRKFIYVAAKCIISEELCGSRFLARALGVHFNCSDRAMAVAVTPRLWRVIVRFRLHQTCIAAA